MKLILFLVAALSVAAFALGAAQSNRAELHAVLSGAGKGKAAWKVDVRPGRTQAEIQIGGENLPPNMEFTVTAGDTQWTTTTDAFGRFRIAQRYGAGPMPNIVPGSLAAVIDMSGNTFLAGMFFPR